MSGLAQDAVVSRVDVLFFSIGDQVYGTDASSVIRIGRAEWWALSPDELGKPEVGARALVFELSGGTGAQLRVDGVRGIRAIEVGELRRLPRAASAPMYAIGACLEGGKTVLLIDLYELHRLKGT